MHSACKYMLINGNFFRTSGEIFRLCQRANSMTQNPIPDVALNLLEMTIILVESAFLSSTGCKD